MKALLLIAALMLLMAEGLAIVNNACKSGHHIWCAPISSILHRVKTGHGGHL
jgi:hypothetical protein